MDSDRERLDGLLKAMTDTSPSRELVESVIATLDDPHPGLRQAALEVLGRFATFAGVKLGLPVLERAVALTMDDSAKVRAEAAASLALVAEEIDHAPRLYALRRLLNDDDDGVRQEAAAALGDMRDTEAADALAERLTDRVDAVRFEAAFALAALGDARGRELLEGALDDRRLRLDAMKALGILGDAASAPALRRFSRRLLLGWADRLTAHATLYLLGDKDAAKAILERTNARNFQERTYAVALIGTHAIVEGREIAERIAANAKDELRDTATTALEALAARDRADG